MSKYKTINEVFEVSWRGMKAQGFQKSEGHSGCRYYLNGFHCVIGQVLPIETCEYWDKMSDSSIYNIYINRKEEYKKYFGDIPVEIMYEFQKDCHDNADSVEASMRLFANKHNIPIPE